MDKIEVDEPDESPKGSSASPRWTGAPSIELAHQLNAQCIELICKLVASHHRILPAFVLENLDLWRLLEPDARARVAAFPFVIVDLRFNDHDWWRLISSRPSRAPVETSPFGDVALETLLFARQSAREDLNVAKAIFAMTSAVQVLIGSLSLSQVRAIALANTSELRIRWHNDVEFWRDLLIASRAGDSEALSAIRRQAKLLFCGECIA